MATRRALKLLLEIVGAYGVSEENTSELLAEGRFVNDERLRAYVEKARKAVMQPAPRHGMLEEEAFEALRRFLQTMLRRRTIRTYSDKPVPWKLVENAVRVAGRAPSGANQQPWTYVIVSDPTMKERMRVAIEEEEFDTYSRRASDEWLDALAPLGTDWHKHHITQAPYVAVVFAQIHGWRDAESGRREKLKHYYVQESVGISVGLFLAALTQGGLATLTHTPNPMGFLGKLLRRPANERCFVVIPIGYAADDALVPVLEKKELDEFLVRI